MESPKAIPTNVGINESVESASEKVATDTPIASTSGVQESSTSEKGESNQTPLETINNTSNEINICGTVDPLSNVIINSGLNLQSFQATSSCMIPQLTYTIPGISNLQNVQILGHMNNINSGRTLIVKEQEQYPQSSGFNALGISDDQLYQPFDFRSD